MDATLDRDTYRSIKRMTRTEMLKFLENYGDHLLENEGNMIDLESLEKDLSQINGIGSKRLDEIMAIIRKHLNM